MSRKHFSELATILNINGADPLIIRDIANLCANDNPRFNSGGALFLLDGGPEEKMMKNMERKLYVSI